MFEFLPLNLHASPLALRFILEKRGFPRIFVKGCVGTTNYYYYDFGLIKIYEMIFGLAFFTTLA